MFFFLLLLFVVWSSCARAFPPSEKLLRACFAVLLDRELQGQLSLLLRLLPRVLRFILLLAYVGFFFSLFGMTIFPASSPEGEAYFGTVGARARVGSSLGQGDRSEKGHWVSQNWEICNLSVGV